MTDEELLKLVKGHFEEDWDENDGWEYSGNFDAFVKFARKIFEEGQQEEIRRQKTGIGYVNGMLVVDEF